MDSRTAAHVLSRIAQLLELQGGNRFKARAYETAARAVVALNVDDIGPLLASGELAATAGIGPATLSVLEELVGHGTARYLEQLERDLPAGLVEMLRVPGLGATKIQAIRAAIGVTSVEALEQAANDGRLATVKGFGEKTVARIRKSIAFLRASAGRALVHRAHAEAARLLERVREHPDVVRAEPAGAVRRWCETVGDVDVVAACRETPARVASHFASLPGVEEATGVGTARVSVQFVGGARLDLCCTSPERFTAAWWRLTGSDAHVREVEALAAARGVSLDAPFDDEAALYAAVGLAWIPPELREGRGEVEAAARGALPALLERDDITGVVHCHSTWSDGKATIEEMVDAARARGWRYLGITDHSQAAFYAGGMSPAQVRAQHEEIDALNARLAGEFRVLKGIEADILADGAVDYDARTLDRFDFVVASVHSRFDMPRDEMTARVLRALEDPHVTILGHPSGRLLLSRDAYAIDLHAVIRRAAELGVVVELNADPHRLDLDWRLLREARDAGCLVEIGPDAHSPQGLDNVDWGVGIARKGWLTRDDVLNAHDADFILAAARARREGRTLTRGARR